MYFVKLGSVIGFTGLIIDIIGAWYIARGLVKKNLKEILQEAPQFGYGVNIAYVMGALTQKVEATIGFYLLAIGFAIQVISCLLWMELSSLNLTVWWLALDISILITIYKGLDATINSRIRSVKKNYLREVIKEHMKTTENPKQIGDLKRYLGYLSVKFDKNISLEEAWPKLLKSLDIR